jgi:Rad3-related DNA helicase
MDRLADRLEEIRAGLNDAWIFYSSQNKDQMEWVFKPINVGPYAKKYLWSHSLFAIGMSGTILSPDIMCQELGIDNCDYIQLPSPFPVENRPIYYKPVVNLNHRTQTDQLPLLRDAIEHDLRLYPHGKVLIHTISYQIRNYLMQTLSCGDRLVTHESDDRQDALENFKITDKPLVMLSPSFDRGVDLRVEANCEAVMVCKMPFLSLGDPQVKAKVETPGGWSWYSLKAAQTLMQSTGRHIRSNTQRGDTWIYDSQFLKLLGRTKNIIPQWWQKALRYRDPITDEIRDF